MSSELAFEFIKSNQEIVFIYLFIYSIYLFIYLCFGEWFIEYQSHP